MSWQACKVSSRYEICYCSPAAHRINQGFSKVWRYGVTPHMKRDSQKGSRTDRSIIYERFFFSNVLMTFDVTEEEALLSSYSLSVDMTPADVHCLLGVYQTSHKNQHVLVFSQNKCAQLFQMTLCMNNWLDFNLVSTASHGNHMHLTRISTGRTMRTNLAVLFCATWSLFVFFF